ncbi:Manganese-transporting ATPase 1 [Wickerhamiella sorbophila]|uniref:Manganese-transporting ATPase 1 n=1 Tax=Wickerhamiella sorbophila TaxID=45607 RepID=A0A2T0FJK8_9ASCO|nr:Manganese-transporting ATPase 1 [Wickerhamiella sorbophila]PRT55172.1 Manganese-transporting ATPase 1 [Wickerhamiella sorbophila]
MLVPVPGIEEAALCNPKPGLMRPYGWPFLALYPAFFYIYLFRYDEYIGASEWTTVFIGAIISLQALLWLMPFWNVSLRESFETDPASSVETASQIKVVPASNAGSPDVCDLVRDDDNVVSFLFQKRRYIYDSETQTFRPPVFAVDKAGVTIGEMQKLPGLTSKDLPALQRSYGPNKFDIPVPTFGELWKEHAVAPFFVFQVFCIALWFLDEMWKYSLFSLFMLFTFESTVVWQRQRTMTEFRGMGVKPYQINVYRDKKWKEIETTELLPGDIVSVTRTPEESGLPCDLLLLHGSAIVNEAMLSGESTPLLKESTETREANDVLELEGIDKNSVLFGGTKVLQVSTAAHGSIPAPPDQGALAVAIRTGFETSQGSLVRVMIFSTERVGAGNKEAYFFILFLLVFAIAASAYVWTEGVKADRKRSKLLLDAVLIITSVVPPELPMELTLAVNTSLAALSKFYIYCTEPFRIPFAGRVDVCCFDKTGTLTAEDLLVEGVAGLKPNNELMDIKQVPESTAFALAAAHALVHLDDGEVAGDPMEKSTLAGLNWEVLPKDHVRSVDNPSCKLQIIKRFQFSSALKRSSSVAKLNDKLLVAVKGAPETIQKMLVKVPADYEETYKHFTREGSRVLAFGCKHLPLSRAKEIYHYPRDDAESKLEFAGFLIFHCPLKPDAIETVKMLNESSHRVVMITGDNPLTAVKVASDVGIVERPTLILDKPEKATSLLSWQSIDGETELPCDVDEPVAYDLFEKYDLCVSGYALNLLQNNEHISDLIRHTWVYARVSPAQKEFILITLKREGYMTLMCGDGTNDVGALKQAHLGVALLNGSEEGMKKMAEKNLIEMSKKMYEKQVDMMRRWNAKPPNVPLKIAHLYPPGPNNPFYIKAVEKMGGEIDEKTRAEIASLQVTTNPSETKAADLADKLTSMMDDNDMEAPALKLGDASVAAPLTSKLANVSAVTHIIRQGRCTLVATIQMYKILALNCLIAAYSLSVLYLAGIKFGDGQSTVSGLLLSVCFMSISRARAVDKLSKERPQPGIFNKYIMGSILGQFAVHIVTLIYVSGEVYKIKPREDNIDLKGKFEPSLLNTAIYLLQLIQQISTFAVNYQGRPFREALHENKGMYYGILGVMGLAFAGATEFIPEMNEALSLVKMSSGFKVMLTVVMVFDFIACFAIEYGLKFLYSDYKPSDIALRLEERQSIVQKRNRKL